MVAQATILPRHQASLLCPSPELSMFDGCDEELTIIDFLLCLCYNGKVTVDANPVTNFDRVVVPVWQRIYSVYADCLPNWKVSSCACKEQ